MDKSYTSNSSAEHSLKILVVDDDEVTRNLLQEILAKEGFSLTLADSGESALKLFSQSSFQIVLSDIRMQELDGLSLLTEIKRKNPEVVVVLMTGFGNLDGAVRAIQAGAFDYISKPFRIEELKNVVRKAVKQILAAPTPSSTRPQATPKTLIGRSPLIVDVYKQLARAALSHSNVLILGESGTGKELVARAIHSNSPRSQKKFIALNCGAFTETLLESELFGYIKGAFTGANSDRKGLIAEAHQGTLFLDEIGDLPLPLQVKLLRVLQEGEFRPVGANQSLQADIRVVAATHRNLEALVRSGKFREDLLYRLKVIELNLPPLRNRLEDLVDLVNHFLAVYAEKNSKKISHIAPEALLALQNYPWPGNIRELEHAIESAVAMSTSPVLFLDDFPDEIRNSVSDKLTPEFQHNKSGSNRSLEDLEKNHILTVLQTTNFNKSKTAEILGIDRATLYRKAVRYGIDLKSDSN